MNTITIQVSGEELETINIELSTEEVAALYKLRKENARNEAPAAPLAAGRLD